VRATLLHIEIDGHPVSSAETPDPSTLQVGHFTAMQVRDRRARGIALHLRRLDSATRELYDSGLDGDLVRDRIRHALADDPDASVRVYVVPNAGRPTPAMIVTVKPPGGVPSEPQRLLSVPYQRPLAHLKQLGHVGQREAQELARDKGFDDALLVGPDGLISETASANIGFLADGSVVWPAAPLLRGITMQLLDRALADRGVPTRRAPLRAPDAAFHDGVIVANARGIAVVGRIDDLAVPVDLERVRALTDVYESVAWDAI
jgi:branched-subunit amino acid aminotransferase/4-amino-4-deoxychorismate lyase